MHKDQLKKIFGADDRPQKDLDQMFRLMTLFGSLAEPPDLLGLFSRYSELQDKLLTSIETEDPEAVEIAFLELYCHVHGHEAPYTSEERKRVDETGGYWAHAGGISPLIKAHDWIKPETVSSDYGAGNGLQGLLFQKLYPHKKLIQIEISSKMVECGKQLQEWLKIPEERVEWIIDDIFNVPPVSMDFIYLYRPVKPVNEGIKFYTGFADVLSKADKEVVIFSIADCLRDFLPPEFEVFYYDGHLTCFKKMY